MAKRKPKPAKPGQPKFVINLGGDWGYYNGNVPDRGVPRTDAEQLTRKEARHVRDHLSQPRLGFRGTVEPVEPEAKRK